MGWVQGAESAGPAGMETCFCLGHVCSMGPWAGSRNGTVTPKAECYLLGCLKCLNWELAAALKLGELSSS